MGDQARSGVENLWHCSLNGSRRRSRCVRKGPGGPFQTPNGEGVAAAAVSRLDDVSVIRSRSPFLIFSVSIGRPATQGPTASDSFTAFVLDHEAQLRHSLSAALGSELGRDAAAEALSYAWENWGRVSEMENPVGYLYRVGRDRGRRLLRRDPPVFTPPSFGRIPMVEPGLPKALGKLPERQRLAVMLVHCFEWSLSEVANLLGISKPTVQTHVARGMARLRREIGVDE